MASSSRSRLGREIGLILMCKLAALALIWLICFSPGHRLTPNTAEILFGDGGH